MIHTDLTNDAEEILADSRKNAGILGLCVGAAVLVGAAFLVASLLVLQSMEKPAPVVSCHSLKSLEAQVVCLDVMLGRAKDHIREGCPNVAL